MNSKGSSIPILLSLFDGRHYLLWVVRMEAYLDACDLWEVVEDMYKFPPLPNNPTVAQIKNCKKRKQRKSKARATLFGVLSSTMLIKNSDTENTQRDLGVFEARVWWKRKGESDASAELGLRIWDVDNEGIKNN